MSETEKSRFSVHKLEVKKHYLVRSVTHLCSGCALCSSLKTLKSWWVVVIHFLIFALVLPYLCQCFFLFCFSYFLIFTRFSFVSLLRFPHYHCLFFLVFADVSSFSLPRFLPYICLFFFLIFYLSFLLILAWVWSMVLSVLLLFLCLIFTFITTSGSSWLTSNLVLIKL